MSLQHKASIGRFLAGGQPDGNDLKAFAASGIRSVVNLRESGEKAGAFGQQEEQRLTSALGLAYAHLPVSARAIGDDTVERFRSLVSSLPGPVFVHCGVGQRAAALALVVEGEEAGLSAEEAIAGAERQGVPISGPLKEFVRNRLRGHATA